MFVNFCYKKATAQLMPDCSGRRMVVWERLHQRHLPHGPFSKTDVTQLHMGIYAHGEHTRMNVAVVELMRRAKDAGVDISDLQDSLHGVLDKIAPKCGSNGVMVTGAGQFATSTNQSVNTTSSTQAVQTPFDSAFGVSDSEDDLDQD
jgi:hypothetical protein